MTIRNGFALGVNGFYYCWNLGLGSGFGLAKFLLMSNFLCYKFCNPFGHIRLQLNPPIHVPFYLILSREQSLVSWRLKCLVTHVSLRD